LGVKVTQQATPVSTFDSLFGIWSLDHGMHREPMFFEQPTLRAYKISQCTSVIREATFVGNIICASCVVFTF